jgi:Ni/Co efflux regulator RcnB
MKAIFAGILAFGLLAAPAFAAPEHHGGGGNHGGGGSHGGGGHASAPRHAESHRAQRHTTVTRHVSPHRTVVTRRTTSHHNTTVHRKVTSHFGNGDRNNNGRGRKVAGFHWSRRAPHRYHAAAWHAPRGFSYRRFSIGERIPAVLLVADFFLTDYVSYGLDVPPDGYIWVRDGNDAVLVDRYTGEVIAVEYDVFY